MGLGSPPARQLPGAPGRAREASRGVHTKTKVSSDDTQNFLAVEARGSRPLKGYILSGVFVRTMAKDVQGNQGPGVQGNARLTYHHPPRARAWGSRRTLAPARA